MEILKLDNITLSASFQNRDEAIKAAGRILVENGYVAPEYVDCMLQREVVISTYVGNNVAVPHGISGSEGFIKESGISVIVVPEGVKYSEHDVAKLIIGIAGRDGQHMDILGQIAMICSEQENVDEILLAKSAQEILEIFQKELV
ncbi:PTS sugar transporter subunit IIA [Salmonella enterica]|nr:PTS sugar transporter subunit IIA [Salmonella enterica]EGJ2477684.1 PTS sugar transporter subunit IIA [Salmonella enterica]EHU0476387.1 PTS sugar transporter subunit IIA [Salmonella enterica]EJL7765369.1 PTS sugar transporter subunit IIA [Salmonella enterica]